MIDWILFYIKKLSFSPRQEGEMGDQENTPDLRTEVQAALFIWGRFPQTQT